MVRNHKTRGQAMGGQLHLDVGYLVALEKPGIKNEAPFPKTLPLAVDVTDAVGNEAGQAITLVELI